TVPEPPGAAVRPFAVCSIAGVEERPDRRHVVGADPSLDLPYRCVGEQLTTSGRDERRPDALPSRIDPDRDVHLGVVVLDAEPHLTDRLTVPRRDVEVRGQVGDLRLEPANVIVPGDGRR